MVAEGGIIKEPKCLCRNLNQSEKLLFQIEVNPIYNLLTSINPNVRFSFIVVSKRINTKFFLKKDDKYFNPEAGTVVDDVVVSLLS